MSIVYRLIVIVLAVFVAARLIREKSIGAKAGAALVLVLFLLRIFLIK